jgi:hypothetical protein
MIMDRKLCTLFALVTLAGCQSTAKAPVHDTFSLVSGKALPNSHIAAIAYGTTTKPVKTRGDYGWLQFTGNIGDNVAITVHSNDGDAVAFLLDSQDDVLAVNDDAELGTTDAHITAPIAADGTYYIAFREYSYARASFVVTLKGTGIFSCSVDTDCIAVPKAGCCHNGVLAAINTSEAEAYDVCFACTDPAPICPLFQIKDTHVAQCNRAAHSCEMVDPTTIVCGGFANQHACPEGFTCQADGPGADRTGKCVANN